MNDHYREARNIYDSAESISRMYQHTPPTSDPAVTYQLNYLRATAAALVSIAQTLHDTRNPQPVGACLSKGHHPMGTDIVIESDCVYDHGHTGAHRDVHGRTWRWEDQSAPETNIRCENRGPSNARCNRVHGHTGDHAGGHAQRWADEKDSDRCHSVGDTMYLDAPRCVRPEGHIGLHGDAINRSW
jgi:hypothetical protein